MSRLWLRAVSCLLVFLLPSTMIANDAVGTLSASGQVTIDGRQAAANGAVFLGERIATAGNAKAVLMSRGAMIALSPDTSLKLGEKALELASGLVIISSSRGTAAQVENLTFSTAPGSASRFLAKRMGDEVDLVAMAGEVYVSDGQQQETVPANSGVKIKVPKGSSPAKMNVMSSDDLALLIAIGAAVAAGVSLGVVNALTDDKKASPSTP